MGGAGNGVVRNADRSGRQVSSKETQAESFHCTRSSVRVHKTRAEEGKSNDPPQCADAIGQPRAGRCGWELWKAVSQDG